jgi:hypothetical protein
MKIDLVGRLISVIVLAVLFGQSAAEARAQPADWKKDKAATYLDERAKTWFTFASASRGEGATQSRCASCHTLVPYALARPILRKLTGVSEPTEYERKLLTQVRTRVQRWGALDTPALQLFYDFSDSKKKESWGTEAVLDALLLATDDRNQGRTAPSTSTEQAFVNLWRTQLREGNDKGSWDWLDFGLEPWESKGGRYLGAALAAIAVGVTPVSKSQELNSETSEGVALLRGYLKDHFAGQHLYNRAWTLWASKYLDGLLTDDQRKEIVSALLVKQQADGGWNLAALGGFVRRDGSTQYTASDGYATGLVLEILQTSGIAKDSPQVAKGLAWLKANQKATGEWLGVSVNKKRNPETHAGKLMTDAATAFAVLALSH